MGLPSPEQARTWGGKLLVDRDGAAIGTVTQIYSDDATGLPEWATIRLGEATVFLPLLDAVEVDGRVRVRAKRDDVAKAPLVVSGDRISEQDEARLYGHYGIEYSPERSASGLPKGIGPIPTRAQLLMRHARGLEVRPLVLAAALTATAVLVAVLGLRRRPSGPEGVLAGGVAAVTSTEGARATGRAALRAAGDTLRQAAEAAVAAADALDEASTSSHRRRRR